MPASGPSQRLRLVTTRDSSPNAAPAGATGSSAYEAEFLKHLSLVDNLVSFVCQRHKLKDSEADDFRSEVRLQLMGRDYEVFRCFQRRSSLRTYLTIVIQRIYLDYRNHLWGNGGRPPRAEAWFNLALAAEALGDTSRAREIWTKYLALDPSSDWAAEARRHLEKLNR